MIYNIDNISLFANHYHRSRRQDNRPYIYRKYRIQPYSKRDREEIRFRQELKTKENLRIQQELQEFRERWDDEVRRLHEMFESGEDDSLFPTERYCESVKEPEIVEAGEDDSLFPRKQYHESGNSRTVDTSQPLSSIDWLLRTQGKGMANGK